ncbi:MAG TPA: hypothetical protein VFD15_01420 [Clostridia bacterium]|nr:hypothetical protein [Clostridia bacterium]
MRKQVVLDSLEGEALRLQTIQERRQEILQSTQALQGLVSGRKETTGLVYDIDSLTPAGLSLESLNIIRGSEGGYMAVLEGKSDSASTVGIFVKALAELTYISDVELVKLRECKDEGAVTFHVIAHIGGGGE